MNCASAKLVVSWLYLKNESTVYCRLVTVSKYLSEIYGDHFRLFGKSYISKWYGSSYVSHFYAFRLLLGFFSFLCFLCVPSCDNSRV